MLGVKEIQKVQVFNLTLSFLLCDLQVYQSPSLHSLQQRSLLHCIRNGPSSGSSHCFQLPPMEGGHGDAASLQKTLQTHNGDGGRVGS